MSDNVIGPTGAGGATDGSARGDVGVRPRAGRGTGSTPLSGATQALSLGSTFSILARRAVSEGQTGPMEGYDRSTYGDGFADVYDDWYASLGDTQAAVDCLSQLAGRGSLLELGVGTGRLAVPLASRGVPVVGLDTSSAMLAKWREHSRDRSPPKATRADMTALPFKRGAFTAVFVAYNTVFNLPDEESQRRCFESVRGSLRDRGVFAVEAFVPAEDHLPRGGVEVRRVTIDDVVFTASRLDPINQTIEGQHVHLSESGIRLRPWFLHYLHPAQLDDIASSVGFTLQHRWAGWRREPYSEDADSHVSVYQRVD